MALQITNRRILSFFEQRPEMDPESIILKFVDIMESLQENVNKTLTNTSVLEILDAVNSMNTKIERNQENNQINLSKCMIELKQEMNEEIKNIMAVNMVEKLEPTMQVKLQAQQIQIVNSTIEKFEYLFDNKLFSLRENTNKNCAILSDQNKKLDNFFNKFENSSKKGAMSENIMHNILSGLYPKAEINSVGQTKETGDIMLLRHQKPVILIENKNWNRPVVQTEVSKFIRDIEVQKCHGIFLSQNTTITTKDNFEINIHDGNVLVYIHEVNNDPEKIKVAVDIIDNFVIMLREFENQDAMGMEVDTISREITDHINAEFQNFIMQKNSMIKMSRDFNQKLVKQLEDFNMPSLENYLSLKYSKASSSKHVCEFCGFVGKNSQSRAAHMRGCQEKKKFEEKKVKKPDENMEICIDTTS